MLILNFTHPLTDEHKAQIEALAGINIDEVRTIPVQIDPNSTDWAANQRYCRCCSTLVPGVANASLTDQSAGLCSSCFRSARRIARAHWSFSLAHPPAATIWTRYHV